MCGENGPAFLLGLGIATLFFALCVVMRRSCRVWRLEAAALRVVRSARHKGRRAALVSAAMRWRANARVHADVAALHSIAVGRARRTLRKGAMQRLYKHGAARATLLAAIARRGHARLLAAWRQAQAGTERRARARFVASFGSPSPARQRYGNGTAQHTARHGIGHGTARHGTALHGAARGTARHGAQHGKGRHTAQHGAAWRGTGDGIESSHGNSDYTVLNFVLILCSQKGR